MGLETRFWKVDMGKLGTHTRTHARTRAYTLSSGLAPLSSIKKKSKEEEEEEERKKREKEKGEKNRGGFSCTVWVGGLVGR